MQKKRFAIAAALLLNMQSSSLAFAPPSPGYGYTSTALHASSNGNQDLFQTEHKSNSNNSPNKIAKTLQALTKTATIALAATPFLLHNPQQASTSAPVTPIK